MIIVDIVELYTFLFFILTHLDDRSLRIIYGVFKVGEVVFIHGIGVIESLRTIKLFRNLDISLRPPIISLDRRLGEFRLHVLDTSIANPLDGLIPPQVF